MRFSFTIMLFVFLSLLLSTAVTQPACPVRWDLPWEWTLSDGKSKCTINCLFKELGPCGKTGISHEIISNKLPNGDDDSYIVCHDHNSGNTLYSINVLLHLHVPVYSRETNLKTWRKGPQPFYASSPTRQYGVTEWYTSRKQVENFKAILQLPDVSHYVSYNDYRFLAKGHLSADSDMISRERQRSSYYYVNSAPQWQSINQGNWYLLEKAVRDWMLLKNKNAFTVVTGTYGTLTLPDINNNDREIYMHIDSNNNGYLPVPKYFWKIVWDRKDGEATAFIATNNPYLTQPPSPSLCGDVCHQMGWFVATTAYKQRQTYSKGYLFCCTAKDWLELLDYTPDFSLLSASLLS